jgi:large subunit ribosomal protein L22
VSAVKKSIRVSPWKLNLIAAQVRRLRVEEARKQMKFSIKRHSSVIDEIIRKTTNLADIRYDLKPAQLEVLKCFVTRATPLKRIKYHSRGRFGKMFRRHSHLNITVGEIDFESKIANAKSKKEKSRWIKWKEEADEAAEEARQERAELDMLRGLDPIEEDGDDDDDDFEEGEKGEKGDIEEAQFEEKKK